MNCQKEEYLPVIRTIHTLHPGLEPHKNKSLRRICAITVGISTFFYDGCFGTFRSNGVVSKLANAPLMLKFSSVMINSLDYLYRIQK